MKKIIFIIICLITIAVSAYGNSQQTYGDLICKYVKNYDGDTITVDIPNIHPIIGNNINIRINGIDTPELKGTTGKVKEKAIKAKRLVEILCKKSKILELRNIKRGKYFRIVADVYIDDCSLADILIRNRLAKYYNGGKKPQW